MKMLGEKAKIKLLVAFIFCLQFAASIYAQSDNASSNEYVRLTKDQNSELTALQTSIQTLSGNFGIRSVKIDLISAVHIAEASYYQDLNNRFKTYDAVLFELIADHTLDRSKISDGSNHPLSIAQKGLQSLLGLSFQLEEVNYNAPNFVHADMSPEQFSQSMNDRGESFSKLILEIMLNSMANSDQRAPPNLSDLIMMGFSQHRAIGFRRTLARQFNDMDSMLIALNGGEGSTIVTERNKVAVRVAEEQLYKGKSKLAIFYGGAHMPNMKSQLESKLGLKASSTEWLTAWNLKTN